jgi:membrane associated rhomboid family serine protease
MPLTDQDILLVAMLIFTFIFAFILGEKKHPGFFVFSGVVGLILAFQLYTLVASLVLSGIFAGISAMIVVYGIVKRPSAGVPEY